VLQLLNNAKPSQYGDLVDASVAKKIIVQGPADADLRSASEAVKAALRRAADSLQNVESFKIGCSQSILTYTEAHDIYGHRVASTYIPIQVVVRNLDSEHEFLMHDVQIAVDTMRFVGGRDKILARGVAEIGQSEDPRNRWIRVAEVLGDLASAVSVPLTSRDFKNGVLSFDPG
jgi:flavin-binding protein dodecin